MQGYWVRKMQRRIGETVVRQNETVEVLDNADVAIPTRIQRVQDETEQSVNAWKSRGYKLAWGVLRD